MPAIYLLTLSGQHYAVWKDEVDSVREIDTIHRLPFSPACITGLAIIDKHSTALADLAALIGLPPFKRSSQATLILVAGQKKDAGFVVSGDIIEITTPKDSIRPMAPYVATPDISANIIYQEKLVPLINLQALYQHINSQDLNPSAPTFPVPDHATTTSIITTIKLFTAGREIFALPADMVREIIDQPPHITSIPLTPESLKGVSSEKNSVIPIIDLAEKMNLPNRSNGKKLLTIEIGNENFGFLIDDDGEIFYENDFSSHPLPPLAKSSLIKSIVICDQGVIPIIDPLAMIDYTPDKLDDITLADQYQPDSDSGKRLKNEDEVVEFALLGVRHALPKNEVRDVIPIAPFRRIPGLQSLVIGIIEYQGEILPVLDLALVFGRLSPLTSDWQMVLINNGNFRALVVTEAIYPERRLPLDMQKKMPISLPNNLVYGCYPDGNIVRLIVNVKELAVHFDKMVVKNFLSSLTKEMDETAAGIVPALLPAEEVIRLEKEEQLREVEAQYHSENIVQSETGEENPRAAEEAETKQETLEQEPEPEECVAGDKESETKIEEFPQGEAESTEPSKTEEAHSGEELIVLEEALELSSMAITDNSTGNPEQPEILNDEETTLNNPARGNILKQEEKLAESLADKLEQLDEVEAHPDKAEKEHLKLEAEDEEERARTREIIEQHELKAQTLARTRQERLKQEEEQEKHRLAAQAKEERARMKVILERQKQRESLLKEKKAQAILEKREKASMEAERLRVEIEAKKRAAKQAIQKQVANQQHLEEILGRSKADTEKIDKEQQARESEEEKLRILTEFRDQKKLAKKDNKLVILLSILLFLLLLIVFIFFDVPEKGQHEQLPGKKIDLSEGIKKSDSVAKTKSPVIVSTTTEEVKKLATKPANNSKSQALGKELNPLTIIVPDNIPITTRTHKVKKGDTLWDISMRLTGNPYNYPLVAQENDIDNPDLIFPEQDILLIRESKQQQP